MDSLSPFRSNFILEKKIKDFFKLNIISFYSKLFNYK